MVGSVEGRLATLPRCRGVAMADVGGSLVAPATQRPAPGGSGARSSARLVREDSMPRGRQAAPAPMPRRSDQPAHALPGRPVPPARARGQLDDQFARMVAAHHRVGGLRRTGPVPKRPAPSAGAGRRTGRRALVRQSVRVRLGPRVHAGTTTAPLGREPLPAGRAGPRRARRVARGHRRPVPVRAVRREADVRPLAPDPTSNGRTTLVARRDVS